MGSPSSGGGYGSPTSGYGSPLASGTMYGGGGFSGQQPAYGMGTGGQYSPQLRQAQTAWQNQYTPAAETQGGQQDLSAIDPAYQNYLSTNNNYASTKLGYTDWIKDQQQKNPTPVASMDNWMPPQQWAPQNMYRQPYGMGAQGNGNAYGYSGQQGNPWAIPGKGMTPNRDYSGMVGESVNTGLAEALAQSPQARIAQANNPLVAPWLTGNQPPSAQPFGVPMQQSAPPPQATPMSQAQAPQQMQAPAPPPPAPPAPRPPAAAPTRANYSPSNPYGGLYANPQADAWEQQQRSGGLPPPVAPQTDMMRKALSGVDNGYGYGTPGGYQLDTAPSTLDPGSMTGLLGFLGGNVGGRTWQGQAADYANWYRNTYGSQAPGGPTAYPF